MTEVHADPAHTAEALLRVGSELADMVRAPADMSTSCPGSQWSVGENATHLAVANQSFARLAKGEPFIHGDGTPESLAVANEQLLQRHPERDGDAAADAILTGARDLAETLAAEDPTQAVATPMGTMSLRILDSYVLTHMLMHGVLMAEALGRPNPMRREYLPLMLPFFAYAMPKTLDRTQSNGLTACYQMHFMGGGRLALMFDNGELVAAAEPTRRVDCHVLADPVAFLSVVMGQKSQYAAIAQGKLLTWGRKPWLALRLVGFFNVP
ncbi:MAG: maleylpyruvate isomerase N-terminal domain-containing protein [Actinomycetota bacterium]